MCAQMFFPGLVCEPAHQDYVSHVSCDSKHMRSASLPVRGDVAQMEKRALQTRQNIFLRRLFFRDVCRVVLGASNAPHHSDQLPSTVSLTKSYLLECGEYYWSIFDVFIHFLTLIGSIRTVGILFWCVSSDQGLYSRFFVPSDQLVFL